MAKDRPPAFSLYARDLLVDKAVMLMSPEERGGYLFLLCHAWLSPEPGVLIDDDAELAVLSGLGARWMACRDRVRAAFHQSGNTLTQKRMVQERSAQMERQRAAVDAGRRSWKSRNGSELARVPQASLEGPLNIAVASAVASAVAVQEPTPSVPPVAAHSVGFSQFWDEWPQGHRVGRLKAQAAYQRARRHVTQQAIMEGLSRAKGSAGWAKEAGRFIPHPTTWLNRGGWDDEYQVTGESAVGLFLKDE